jgi:hypothetical protein
MISDKSHSILVLASQPYLENDWNIPLIAKGRKQDAIQKFLS